MGKRLVLETLPLRKAVERDVVGGIKNRVDFVVFVNRCENVNFLVHLFARKASFVKARGGGAGEVFANERERTPEAVTLEGADDFDAGLFLDIIEDFHVAAETCFVKYETRTWNLRIVEHGKKDRNFKMRVGFCLELRRLHGPLFAPTPSLPVDFIAGNMG